VTHDRANLVELCWHHHRLAHEGGWRVRPERDGTVTTVDPLGRIVRPEPRVRAGDRHGVERHNHRRGVAVDPTTPIARWYGDPLDLDHVTTALWCIDHRTDRDRTDHNERDRGRAGLPEDRDEHDRDEDDGDEHAA
jgi:hypothetical protein